MEQAETNRHRGRSCVAPAGRAAVFCVLGLWCGSCNTRNPILDSAVTPSPPAAETAVARLLPPSTISQLGINPQVVTGGGTSLGTATTTFPAPAGGLVIRLSTTDPAVAVPPSVTIPAGSESIAFMVATQEVPTDRVVSISASASDRTVSAQLQVWTALAAGFSYVSETGDYIGGGGFGRFTPANTAFSGRCFGSVVQISMTAPGNNFWTAYFGAAGGAPLGVGTYEAATRSGLPNQPRLEIDSPARGCNIVSGRFVVQQAEYTAAGNVRRFWATFEQHCESAMPALLGEIRLVDVTLRDFPSFPPLSPCRLP
jgi:hypothetical protein